MCSINQMFSFMILFECHSMLPGKFSFQNILQSNFFEHFFCPLEMLYAKSHVSFLHNFQLDILHQSIEWKIFTWGKVFEENFLDFCTMSKVLMMVQKCQEVQLIFFQISPAL